MIPHIENPKESTSTTANHQFIKIAEYRSNTQKPAVLLYTGNEQSEKEIMKISP